MINEIIRRIEPYIRLTDGPAALHSPVFRFIFSNPNTTTAPGRAIEGSAGALEIKLKRPVNKPIIVKSIPNVRSRNLVCNPK